MKIKKIENFRQLGNYPTIDGRSVKNNLLFRSGTVGNKGHELEKIGIKTVLDLRSKREAESDPDLLPNGIEYLHSPAIASLDESQHFLDGIKQEDFNMKTLLMGGRLTKNQILELQEYFLSTYDEMAHNPAPFRSVFDVLLQKPGQPLLFHCTAGKDRTGVTAAYILLALGVSKEIVLEDYLLSNKYREQEIERERQALLEGREQDEDFLDFLNNMMDVKPEYLNKTLTAIESKHGSFNVFLEDALGLSAQEISLLKQNYLN